jgi:MFS transporter, DHA3 family, macrolide efflux protein
MQVSTTWKYAQKWKAPFFTIWTGQAFSLLGSQLVSFALIWWLTKTTGSATVLSMASLAGLLPQVILGPIVGTLVDRWNRRLVMIVADLTIAAVTAALAWLFWTGQVQVWHVFVLMAVRSIAGGFHWPAMLSSTSLMVPGEHFTRIQGLNQMLQGFMNILSAPLGALALEFLPIEGVLAIDVSTAILAVLPLMFIPIPQPARKPVEPGTRQGTFWHEFKEGFRFAFSWPGLVIIGIMATIINLVINPGFSLLPIMVTEHFFGGAFELAWIEAAFGVGIIAGGLLLSIWGGFKRRILTSLMGMFGMGLGILLIGYVPSWAFYASVVLLFFIGFFNPITNGPLFAAVQAAVRPDMQGRVFTLITSIASAMTPLGLAVAGPVADIFGVQIWFKVGGVVTMFMAVLAFFIPAVMNFEKGRKEDIPPEPAVAPAPSDPVD